MQKKDTPLDQPSKLDKSLKQDTSNTAETLAQKLEEGLAYYKIRKFGKALACFRELVKNLKFLDEGKQLMLAKALQGTTSGCLKKEKYRKALKSAKLALRVLACLAQKIPGAEIELKLTQEKLLSALQGHLNYTIDQHRQLLTQEFNRGKLLKASLIPLCREGFNLINKPLASMGADNQKIKMKNTRAQQIFNDTLKEILEWLLKEAKLAYEDKNYLGALIYRKIATGPLREALEPTLDPLEKSKKTLDTLTQTQEELESRLKKEAEEDLQSSLTYKLNTGDSTASLHFVNQLEQAKKSLRAAASKYHYLENQEKISELQQLLKNLNASQENSTATQQHRLSHASFLEQNLSGGSKKKE